MILKILATICGGFMLVVFICGLFGSVMSKDATFHAIQRVFAVVLHTLFGIAVLFMLHQVWFK